MRVARLAVLCGTLSLTLSCGGGADPLAPKEIEPTDESREAEIFEPATSRADSGRRATLADGSR